MCRKNVLTLSWLGAFAGLALFFVGCPAQQISHAPAGFWTYRDLEDVKAEFDSRLMTYDRTHIDGPAHERVLHFVNVKHHEVHMIEVLGSMRNYLMAMVGKKGGEVVGSVRTTNEGGAIVASFEFDYRRGKTTGIVRGEVMHNLLNRQHFDLNVRVTEHHHTAENQTTF